MPDITDPFKSAGRALGGGGSSTPTTQFRVSGQRTKPVYVKNPKPATRTVKHTNRAAKRKGHRGFSFGKTMRTVGRWGSSWGGKRW